MMDRFLKSLKPVTPPPNSSSSESENEQPSAKPPTPAKRTSGSSTSKKVERGASSGGSASTANPGSAKLPVQIRTLNGKTYKIPEARSDWTVNRLKEEFKKWHGPEAERCSLFYKAKRLNDRDTLDKYKIEPNSFVQANFRSTGGSPVDLQKYIAGCIAFLGRYFPVASIIIA